MGSESSVGVGGWHGHRAHSATDKRLAELSLLNEIGRICSNSDDEDRLLAAVTRELSNALYSDNCGFLMLDPDREVLVTHASFVLSDPEVSTEDKSLSTGIVGQVARSGVPQRVDDVTKHSAYLAADRRTRSELCVPLQSNKQVLGVLNIESMSPAAFSATDERLMIAAVDLVANAISRIRSIEALKSSEQRYRTILEDQTELICRFTPDCRLVWVNEAYARAFGMTREQLTGHSFLSFIPRSEHANVREFFDGFRPNRVVRTHEHSATCAAGVRWHQWTNRAFFDSSGNVVEFQGVARDITERKLAEEALRKSEARYRALVDTCSDAIFLLDETGKIRSANPAAAKMNGYSVGELLTMNIRDLDVPDSAERVPDRMERLKRGETLEFNVRHRRRDGTTFPVEVVANGIEIDGEWLVLSFDRDISRREMAEQALQRVTRGTASSTGEEFYRSLVQHLAVALDCETAFLSTLVGANCDRAKMLAAYVGGRFLENHEYALNGTPCEFVISRGYCFHGSGVQRLYPSDSCLIDLNAESYLGIPLTASDGQVLGILGVVDRLPMSQSAEVDSVLEVFAQRAVVEIERTMYEQSLCESRAELANALERLELAVNGTSDGLWDWDVEQGSVWISPRGLELLQISADDVTADNDFLAKFVHPADASHLVAATKRHVDEGAPLNVDLRFRSHGESYRWFRVRGKAIRNKGEQRHRMAGSFQDITEQKEFEYRLKLTQHAVDVSADAVFFIRQDGSFSYVNDQASRCLGYTYGELLGMAVKDINPNYPGDSFQRLWEQTLRERALCFESVHRRKDGSTYECEIRSTFIAYDSHEFIVSTVRDISDFRRSQEDLRNTTERLKEAQAIANLGSYFLDLKTWDLTWSDELYRIHGLDPSQPITLEKSLAFVHVDDRDYVRSALAEVALSGGVDELEFRIVDTHGEVVWIFARRSVITNEAGEIIAMQGTCQDISARKKVEQRQRDLEAQMLHSQKLESLGVLAGGIAHDFNNLITAMLGYSDLALAHVQESSPARHMLDEIGAAARRATELTKQMLSYSGRGNFVVETVRLDSVVRELTSLLQTAVSKKAKFELDLQSATVEGDEAQLGQVIMNLVTNASEALGDENGSIEIRTGVRTMSASEFAGTLVNADLPDGDYAYLIVSDSGCGMTEKTLAKIFDPFFTTKFTGRGLGLAAVLGIVRSHSGTIAVDSSPESGTRFEVYLPAVKMLLVDRAVSTLEPVRGGGTVLLVEDDPNVLRLAKSVLENGGYQVITANNGQSGLSLFKEHSGVIVGALVDLKMPRLDGMQLLERIREESSVGVLVMSGFDEQDSLQRLDEIPACGFIEKPFQPRELLKRFSQVLEGSNASARL